MENEISYLYKLLFNRILFPILLLCAFTSNVNAGQNIRNATITVVGTQDGTEPNELDTFWIQLDKTIEPTSCHTSALNRVVFDLNKDVSKITMSMVLTAYTTGKTVDIDTYNSCISGWSTVRNLYFSPNQ